MVSDSPAPARSQVRSIKAKKASGFQKPALFHKVMTILEAHHFRLPVCRFVIDLFDKRVMRQIVLEEDAEEEEGNGDGAEQHEGNRTGGISSSKPER